MPDATRFAGVIAGKPGDKWTNNTDRVKYQLIVSFTNSCAACIQNANAISNWWPIPFHHGCNCRQVPVAPGQKAEAFLNFREEVEKLPPDQQARVMGVSNYKLVKQGKVQWTDVVTKTRIRPLHEVVQRAKLTEKDLTKAGLSLRVARDAIAKVNSPEKAAAKTGASAAVERLKQLGMSEQQIRDAVRARLAGRVGIVGKPSGPSRPGQRPTTPPKPPTGPTGGFSPPSRPIGPRAPAPQRRIAARSVEERARVLAAQIVATPPSQRRVDSIATVQHDTREPGEALPSVSPQKKAAVTRAQVREIAQLQQLAESGTRAERIEANARIYLLRNYLALRIGKRTSK